MKRKNRSKFNSNNRTSKRVGLRPQKETTPENLAFHGCKQKTQFKHEAENEIAI